MRVSTACQACRSRRRKCETSQFGTSCTYCTNRGIQCTRDSSSAVLPTSSNLSVVVAPQAQSLLLAPLPLLSSGISPLPLASPSLTSPEICLELVHLYFDFIHDQFHSLFHRPSVIEDVEAGRASRVLLLAMMALGARFSMNRVFSNINPRERGDTYARESNRLLDLRDASLTTAQACVLLGAFSITRGEAAAESVFYCVACRIANLLNLSNRATTDAIEREVNIRVWWSLCMIDVWSSAGVGLPKQMPSPNNVPLPIDEKTFLSLRRGDMLSPSFDSVKSSMSSLLAQMIRLNQVLAMVNDLNERTVAGRTSGVHLDNEVMSLSTALDSWYNSIPISMHDNAENLQAYAAQGLGRMFVAVYLGYYHFGQLLFYQFLHGDTHSTVISAKYYASRYKYFAEALCSIVYLSHSTPHSDVQYTMVGHILVIASTVQIHTLLFSSSDAAIAEARGRLEKNFEILWKLRGYWPTLDVSFERLRAFHRACQGGKREMEGSYRFDMWMLRFLEEFAEVVGDRGDDGVDERVWSLENIGGSPGIEMNDGCSRGPSV